MLSQRIRGLAFGACIVSGSLLAAQNIMIGGDDSRQPRAAVKETPESKKAKADRDALADALLTRAYSLTKQTSDAEKAYILARLAEASTKTFPQRSKDWATETFSVTAGLPNDMQRAQNEISALNALAENDADAALDLLAKLETPKDRDGQPVPDLRNGVTTMLFQRYWQKNGMDGVDKLTAAARQLGESGAYPYMAISMLIRQVKAKNPDKAKDLINEALAYFNRRQTAGFANDQFAMFLRQNRAEIPTPLLKDLLEKLVAQAIATKDDPSVQSSMVMANEKGAAAKLNSAASILMFSLMPMINDLDPDWAKKLETQYQELKAAADVARAGEQRVTISRGFNAGGGAPPRAMMEEMQSMEIDDISQRDPQRALKMNAELTDPSVRAASGARLAAVIAKSNPEQADELLKKAKEAIADAKEPADKLRILVGLAQAQAAMNDKAAFETTLQSGYSLGEDLFRKGLDKNPNAPLFTQPGFDAMSRLTMSAVRVDYAATMNRIDAVRSPVLQALLLITAAEGLDPDARPRPRGMRIRIES